MSKPARIVGLTSFTLYAILIGVTLAPESRNKFSEAFGPRPFGLPVTTVVIVAETILFLPFPFVVRHWVRISEQAQWEGLGYGDLMYLFSVGDRHPHLRRSQRACFAGLAYYAAICAAWIIYAAIRRI